jgi:DNA modification methylase
MARAEEEEAAERRRRAAEAEKLDLAGFHHGDFREVAKIIPDGSVDLIFADPPYDRGSLPLYGELASIGAAKLVEGGSLICYFGQYQLAEVVNLLTPHLRLWWALAVQHTGTSARMREYGVIVRWKPLLWFVKGTRGDKNTFVEDLVESRQEKGEHPWQQSIREAAYYVGKLVPKGGLVFDPFCGGGTTVAACRDLGIRFVTCDTDGESLAIAKNRVA